ncbi:unnamed protein product, partial [Timema podura]|nr:unnamed protein product [Timema podura]
MITFLKLCDKCLYTLSGKSSRFNVSTELIKVFVKRHIHQHQPKFQMDSEEFRVLDLKPKKSRPFTRKQIEKAIAMPPRGISFKHITAPGNVAVGSDSESPSMKESKLEGKRKNELESKVWYIDSTTLPGNKSTEACLVNLSRSSSL